MSWWRIARQSEDYPLQPDARHEEAALSAPEMDPMPVQRWPSEAQIPQKKLPGSEGEVIAEADRSLLETAFQQNLADVRIHRDDEAAQLTESAHASAFTTGRDIYFARGAYSSTLLAHEVGHVMQQSRATSLSGGEDAFLEGQAQAASSAVASGHMAEIDSGRSAPAMQRQAAPGSPPVASPASTNATPPINLMHSDSITLDSFDIDKSILSGGQKQKLDEFAERLKGYLTSKPDSIVTIVGFADAPGTESHNLAIGKERAQRVRDYLAAKGVASSQLNVGSLGEGAPVIASKGYEAKNRRVEINIVERIGLRHYPAMTPTPLLTPPTAPGTIDIHPKPDLTYHPHDPTPDEDFQDKYRAIERAVREAQAEEARHPGTSASDAAGAVLRKAAAKLGLPKWVQDRAESLGKDLPSMGTKAIIDRIAGERGMDATTQNALKAAVDALSRTRIK